MIKWNSGTSVKTFIKFCFIYISALYLGDQEILISNTQNSGFKVMFCLLIFKVHGPLGK
jgi:hypothetical protein